MVSLMLGSLGQIDLIVIKGGQPFHPRPAAGRDDSIRAARQKNKHIRADELSKLSG